MEANFTSNCSEPSLNGTNLRLGSENENDSKQRPILGHSRVAFLSPFGFVLDAPLFRVPGGPQQYKSLPFH